MRKTAEKEPAIKTALGYIKDKTDGVEAIGVMDSDGQHLPEDMMKLLAAASLNKEALVLGVRAVGKDMPTRSRLGNKITRNVFRMVSGVAVSDTQTGLRAFSPELVERLLSIEGERYEYEMNVLIKLAKEGVPIQKKYRSAPFTTTKRIPCPISVLSGIRQGYIRI